MSQVTLQQAQTSAILSLLNLNTPTEPSTTATTTTQPSSGRSTPSLKVPPASGPPIWKILILDQRTKDVLATVLRVQDLRDVGVTLHVYVLLHYVFSRI
jgi:sec1 family domain-containing protein 1